MWIAQFTVVENPDSSLVPRLSPCASEKFSILQAMESWAGPGNEATQTVATVHHKTILAGKPLGSFDHCFCPHKNEQVTVSSDRAPSISDVPKMLTANNYIIHNTYIITFRTATEVDFIVCVPLCHLLGEFPLVVPSFSLLPDLFLGCLLLISFLLCFFLFCFCSAAFFCLSSFHIVEFSSCIEKIYASDQLQKSIISSLQ